MIFLVAGCFLVLAGLVVWQAYSAIVERDKFAQERLLWMKERGELLTRVQAPQAAPFMFEPDEKDAENDMPTLPGFRMTEEERERALRELEEAGYSEGPAG